MPRIPLLGALLAIIIGTYLLALSIPVMDEDASQYAAMSWEMATSKSFLQVYEQGQDYLDKPPFLFWINSIFMLVLGGHTWVYKLPSLLFLLLGIRATFLLGKQLYNETIAWHSALFLASFQAIFLITNDVRTDTILLSFTVMAIQQLHVYFTRKSITHFFMGCVCVAGAMLTKGPVGLLIPVLALGSDVVLKKQWQFLWRPVYLLGLLLIALLLLPMSIGLYQQFDLHPEKIVNSGLGETQSQVSGLRFYYWTQSFGRLTGESKWNNGAYFSFLFENLLWGLLPFTIFFIAGLGSNIVSFIRQKGKLLPTQEAITTGGFILAYILLGKSKYQLPHYIYVVLPLIAIITAKNFVQVVYTSQTNKLFTILRGIQWGINVILIAVATSLVAFSFPHVWVWVLSIGVLGILVIVYLIAKPIKYSLVAASIVAIVTTNILLSGFFYPNILQYQAGNVVGKFIQQQSIPTQKVIVFQEPFSVRNIHFYAKAPITRVQELPTEIPSYILTGTKGLNVIQQRKIPYQILLTGTTFHITELTAPFLNPATRTTVCEPFYFVKTTATVP